MRLIGVVLAGALVCGAGAAGSARAAEKPSIDMVFCIDCSGSMGGVIETAKQKVWAIVNEVAKARPAPVLRIGLLGYGDGDRQYRSFPLTDDLDEVYKNLMTFRDQGWGDEFVGLAIHKANNEMRWASGRQVLKVVYVVGNETARQGPADFDYARTAPAAIKDGIVVNAIYCGSSGGQETWREFARMADGQYLEIGGQGGAITVQTPFDTDLAKLSTQLNTTYVPFGREGLVRQKSQAAQDANAGGFGGGVAAERALSKSAPQYNARHWDLVDASREKDFDWTKVKTEELPAELQKMTLEQRKAYVAKKGGERAAIQNQVKELGAKRDAYVKAEVAKKGLKAEGTFDDAVRKSLAQQAKKKGFEFGK